MIKNDEEVVVQTVEESCEEHEMFTGRNVALLYHNKKHKKLCTVKTRSIPPEKLHSKYSLHIASHSISLSHSYS